LHYFFFLLELPQEAANKTRHTQNVKKENEMFKKFNHTVFTLIRA